MEKLDLGWGNPYFLLEILDNQLINLVNRVDFKKIVYEEDNGNPKLLKKIKQITEETTGNKYKYYIITNGATQGLNTVMRVWERDREITECITSKFGYPYYPGMIDKAMTIVHSKKKIKDLHIKSDQMAIIDSPCNPFGKQYDSSIYIENRQNVVWDAVYHNPIYAASKLVQPNHEVHVNSFSKLLGLTGARVGWIATNDKYDFERFSEESLYENATVSQVSQELVLKILESLDIYKFMQNGRISLDTNRDAMDKISSLIGTDVPNKGMFYCAETDSKMFKLFDKANIQYVKLGNEKNPYIRLNLGQTKDIILEAVKRLEKADRRK